MIFHINKKHEYGIFFLLFCIVTYLAFKGLDYNCFWDDEAHVAFIAKNYLKTGHLTAWDGRNLMTFENGRLLDKNLETINPPFEYLLCAYSFKLFGTTTWAGRFPFVILGLLSLIVFFLILKEESFACRWYSLSLMAFSYSYLLNIRQCRYYSLVLLFSLLSYYTYKRCLVSQKPSNLILFLLSLFLFFESHYLICGVFTGALVVNHLLFHRHAFDAQARKKTLIVGGIFGLWVLIRIFGFNILERPDIRHTHDSFGGYVISRFVNLIYYFRDLDDIGYIPGFFVVCLILLAILYRKDPIFPKHLFEWVCFICLSVLFLSLFTPQLIEWQGIRKNQSVVRYLVALIPFAACFTGALLAIIHKKVGAILAVSLCIITLSTNLFSFRMSTGVFRWLLPHYIKEIHRNYLTPYEAAISYLRTHTGYNDTVYAISDYMNLPLLFYLGDKLKIGGSLGEDTKLPKEVLDTLNAPIFFARYFPQMIIAFGLRKETDIRMNFLCRDKYTYLCDSTYEFPYTERIEVFCLDYTRPELTHHNFGPVEQFNTAVDAIYIFKRWEKPVVPKPVAVDTISK